jgi:hypothetical protein
MKTLPLTAAALLTVFAFSTGCNDVNLKEVEYDDAGDWDDADEGSEDEGEENDGGDGDGDGDNGDGDGDGDFEPPTCGGETIMVESSTPNLMLVLDKSGSMTSQTWEQDGETVTRWNSLHGVVSDLLDSSEGDMNLGAALFPAVGADHNDADLACIVSDGPEVEVGPNNGSNILAAMPGASEATRGATPATAGILNGLAHLESVEDGGSSAMILVTDGAANCKAGADDYIGEYDDALAPAVQDAYERAGIPTYVVGIDMKDWDNAVNVDPRASLNDVAEAGGVPRQGDDAFYDVQSQDDLALALQKITSKVACTVSLETAAPGPAYTEVSIDGETIDYVDNCEDGDGWTFTSDAYPYNTVELCGSACDALQDSGTVAFDYTCPPEG